MLLKAILNIMKKLLFAGFMLLALSAPVFAQTNLSQGGTGWTTSTAGDLLVGTSSVLRYSRLPIGSAGYILQASSTSPFKMAWVATSTLGISSSPAGNDTEVQFNDNGVFGADPSFTFNKATGILMATTAGITNFLDAVGGTLASVSGSTLNILGTLALPNLLDGCLELAGGNVTSTGVACGSGGGGSPASPDTSVQFNDGGSFGGSSSFTWDNIYKTLSLASSSRKVFLFVDGATNQNNLILTDSTSTYRTSENTNIEFITTSTSSSSFNNAEIISGVQYSPYYFDLYSDDTLAYLTIGGTSGSNSPYIGTDEIDLVTGGVLNIASNASYPNYASLITSSLTAARNFTFPNVTGTFALGTGTAGNCAQWSATNVLTTTGSPCGSGGGSSSVGSAGYVQFASSTAGAFDGSSDFTWSTTTNTLSVGPNGANDYGFITSPGGNGIVISASHPTAGSEIDIYSTIYAITNDNQFNIFPVSGVGATLDISSLAASSKIFTFPNKSGTFAMTSDIPSFADAETPSGTINGSNVTFTLAHTPSPVASLQLFVNGQYMTAGGVDYTLSTATITFVVAPPTSSIIRAHYRY
jgi:hypothetical protein